MRDIEFRGKRRDGKGDWTYGYFFQIWERTYILWGTTNDIPNMLEVIPETVEFNVGEYHWFNIKLFEKMAMQSREYKKRLLEKQ